VNPSQRIYAIDWMRGFVMILMALDHASEMWNAGRFNADSAYLLNPETGAPVWIAGTAIPAVDFFTRWVTHLCAPTFLFLTGTSLALSIENRARRGESAKSLDRHLLIRALVILGLEGLLTLLANYGALILQVLFAIGASLLLMIPLRRVATPWLLAGGLVWFVFGELITTSLIPIGEPVPALAAVTLAPVYADQLIVIYPVVPWLAMLVCGWAFGRYLIDLPNGNPGRIRAEGALLGWGLGAIALFIAVRGLDAYGNMGLYRDGTSLVRWLHVSKYPPALAFIALELGLMALMLLGFSIVERRLRRPPWAWNPLLVFGQTALFFYVLHFLLLGAAATIITGGMRQAGLPETYIAAAAVLVVLYPVCAAYRAYKRNHPTSWSQYF